MLQAQRPRRARRQRRAGVTVSVDCSSTVWSAIASIATVPTLCVTVIENSSVSASPVAAVAVSVYGP